MPNSFATSTIFIPGANNLIGSAWSDIDDLINLAGRDLLTRTRQTGEHTSAEEFSKELIGAQGFEVLFKARLAGGFGGARNPHLTVFGSAVDGLLVSMETHDNAVKGLFLHGMCLGMIMSRMTRQKDRKGKPS